MSWSVGETKIVLQLVLPSACHRSPHARRFPMAILRSQKPTVRCSFRSTVMTHRRLRENEASEREGEPRWSMIPVSKRGCSTRSTVPWMALPGKKMHCPECWIWRPKCPNVFDIFWYKTTDGGDSFGDSFYTFTVSHTGEFCSFWIVGQKDFRPTYSPHVGIQT